MRNLFASLLILITTGSFAQDIAFPLKASSNQKYLVDQKNTPVFLNGCASWRLPFDVTYKEAKAYVLDRKSKKFNAVLIHITPGLPMYARSPKAFTDNDVNKPNEEFFKHLDSLVEMCGQLNMAVMMAPLYLGCCHDGWLEVIQQYKEGESKCRQYGQWISNRYKKISKYYLGQRR